MPPKKSKEKAAAAANPAMMPLKKDKEKAAAAANPAAAESVKLALEMAAALVLGEKDLQDLCDELRINRSRCGGLEDLQKLVRAHFTDQLMMVGVAHHTRGASPAAAAAAAAAAPGPDAVTRGRSPARATARAPMSPLRGERSKSGGRSAMKEPAAAAATAGEVGTTGDGDVDASDEEDADIKEVRAAPPAAVATAAAAAAAAGLPPRTPTAMAAAASRTPTAIAATTAAAAGNTDPPPRRTTSATSTVRARGLPKPSGDGVSLRGVRSPPSASRALTSAMEDLRTAHEQLNFNEGGGFGVNGNVIVVRDDRGTSFYLRQMPYQGAWFMSLVIANCNLLGMPITPWLYRCLANALSNAGTHTLPDAVRANRIKTREEADDERYPASIIMGVVSQLVDSSKFGIEGCSVNVIPTGRILTALDIAELDTNRLIMLISNSPSEHYVVTAMYHADSDTWELHEPWLPKIPMSGAEVLGIAQKARSVISCALVDPISNHDLQTLAASMLYAELPIIVPGEAGAPGYLASVEPSRRTGESTISIAGLVAETKARVRATSTAPYHASYRAALNVPAPAPAVLAPPPNPGGAPARALPTPVTTAPARAPPVATVAAAPTSMPAPPTALKQLCIQFMHGRCKKGDGCDYLHAAKPEGYVLAKTKGKEGGAPKEGAPPAAKRPKPSDGELSSSERAKLAAFEAAAAKAEETERIKSIVSSVAEEFGLKKGGTSSRD